MPIRPSNGSAGHWYHAGVMRSFHRYASDLMVLSIAIHLLREFSLDRYRGTRWFSWFTGIPLIWFLYISGITGYWLVWDSLAQYVAMVSAKLLDLVPIFGEPLARNFLTPEICQPLLLAAGLPAHRRAADASVRHVDPHPAHLASEGEPAATLAVWFWPRCWRCRCGSRR